MAQAMALAPEPAQGQDLEVAVDTVAARTEPVEQRKFHFKSSDQAEFLHQLVPYALSRITPMMPVERTFRAR